MEMKVTPEQVLDSLTEDGPLTVERLAGEFDVSPQTIKKRLRILRKDGTCIVHNGEGLQVVTKDTVTEENADTIRDNIAWMWSLVRSMADFGKTLKKPLISARKILKLTRDERAAVKRTLLQIGRVIDAVDVDEDMES